MARHLLTEANDGDSFEVEDGDIFSIGLSEQAMAGYAWQVEQAPGGVEILIRPVAPSHNAPGASASVQVIATVRAATDGWITLRHRRPWGPADDDASFRISMKMKQ